MKYFLELLQQQMGFIFEANKAFAASHLHYMATKEAYSSWWKGLSKMDYGNILWPSIHLSGWYDFFLTGGLQAFEGYQKRSDPSVRGRSSLFVGPLGHCLWATNDFKKNLVVGRTFLPLAVGARLMRGEEVGGTLNHVTFYVMGASDAPDLVGNYWVSLPDEGQLGSLPPQVQAGDVGSTR